MGRNKTLLKTTILVLLVLFVIIPERNEATITLYTAHVSWHGYNLTSETNCGDGSGNACEVKMQVKSTTSTTSCSGRSASSGSYQTVYTSTSDLTTKYELSWANTGSAPCLTFDVQFFEDTAGSATSQYTYTVSSGGSPSTNDLSNILGSGNGYYEIQHWLTIEELPYGGPGN